MNNYRNYIIVALLVVIAVLVLIYIPKNDQNLNPGSQNGNGNGQAVEVTDYLSCAEAGYPIMESYPAQCRTPDGRTFTEDISENAEVIISAPTWGQTVNSPMTVTGRAKGNWFFEANLPVRLEDQNGKVLAQKGAQADGEWMTTDYVSFSVVLEFAQPSTEYGRLVIEKDNPSGLPQNDASYAIPIRFR